MATKPKSRRKTADPIPPGFLFHPVTGRPRKAPRLPPGRPMTAAEIEVDKQERAARKARLEAQRAAKFARLAGRPADMRRDAYQIPDEAKAFLEWRMRTVLNRGIAFDYAHGSGDHDSAIEEAFMLGCREGFIEGFLYGEEKARPGAMKNRERLRRQNMDKLERLGIADRNAAIAAAFQQLEAEVPGAEDRKQLLAERCHLTARQIHNILRSAGALKRP